MEVSLGSTKIVHANGEQIGVLVRPNGYLVASHKGRDENNGLIEKLKNGKLISRDREFRSQIWF